MPPRFSIATPTRNALGKLRRCVGSVRGQTGVDVQHLVQDAGSSDGTSLWLQQQPELAWVSEPDRGMYDAINKAWSRSSGEILSWLNADEQYLPGTLKWVSDYFDENPSVDVVFGDYIVCNDNGDPIALRREIPFRRIYVVNGFLYAYSCTLFYRRRLLEKGLLKLDESLRYASDKDLLLRLEAAGASIRHLPRYLALFGVDGSNLSTHSQVAVEAEAVRSQYGAVKSLALRQAILGARRVERFLRGSYSRRGAEYQFACDEVPTYRHVSVDGIGGRYTLATAGS
jgi:glycosyltransferase involved in cell wall biosynthesis